MKILAIGAHPDDVELGCGGTLIRHVLAGDDVTMLVLTDGRSGPGNVAQRIEEQVAASALIGATLVWGNIPDLAISQYGEKVTHLIEHYLDGVDRLYTHSAEDTHPDHEAAAKFSFGAARNLSQILAYESPSARRFVPNVYVEIADTLEKKVAALEMHATQVAASNRVDMDAVRATAHYHGNIVRVRAAEAFVAERMVLTL
jgi:LmbE family N-acetylglucosaminyl deacetylase